MESNRDKEAAQPGYTGKHTGMQGVDKAPGEEPAAAPGQFVQQTQKGQNNVDADPDKESDQPLDQQDI